MSKKALIVSDNDADITVALDAVCGRGWSAEWILVVTTNSASGAYEAIKNGAIASRATAKYSIPAVDEPLEGEAGPGGWFCTIEQAIGRVRATSADVLIADLNWRPQQADRDAGSKALAEMATGAPQLAEAIHSLGSEGDYGDLQNALPGLAAVLSFFEGHNDRFAVLFSDFGPRAGAWLRTAGLASSSYVHTGGSASRPDVIGKVHGELVRVLNDRFPAAISRPSELRAALTAIAGAARKTLHQLLAGEGGTTAQTECQGNVREFLGVDDTSWSSVSSDSLSLAEDLKSILGLRDYFTGSGAWLTALAAYNSLATRSAWTAKPIDIAAFQASRADLQALHLSASKLTPGDELLADRFYSMCCELFAWDKQHAHGKFSDRQGQTALRRVTVGPPGRLEFELEFPYEKVEGGGLDTQLFEYFTNRSLREEHLTAQAIWRFVSASVISAWDRRSAEIHPARIALTESGGTSLRWGRPEWTRWADAASGGADIESPPTVLIVDNEHDRRERLARAFSGVATVFMFDPDTFHRLSRFDASGAGRECFVPHAPKRVSLMLRHLGDNEKPCPVGASRIVYYGGNSAPDLRFVRAEDASARAGNPAAPREWTSGPQGFLLWRPLDPDGKTSLARAEAEGLITWATQGNGHEPLPAVLRQDEPGDERLVALSLLCQGCLAVLSQTADREKIGSALRAMGWTTEFEATDVGKQVCATIRARNLDGEVVLKPGWWREGLGGSVPELNPELATMPDLGPVQRLLSALGGQDSLSLELVIEGFEALWAHLQGK